MTLTTLEAMCLMVTTTLFLRLKPAREIVRLHPNASSGLGTQDTMAHAGTSLKQTLPLDLVWFRAQNTVENKAHRVPVISPIFACSHITCTAGMRWSRILGRPKTSTRQSVQTTPT